MGTPRDGRNDAFRICEWKTVHVSLNLERWKTWRDKSCRQTRWVPSEPSSDEFEEHFETRTLECSRLGRIGKLHISMRTHSSELQSCLWDDSKGPSLEYDCI